MQNVGRSILNCSSTSVLLKRCKSTKLKQIRQISLNHHQICNEQLRFGNRRNFEEGLKSKLHLNIFLHFAILQNVKKRKWTFQFLSIDNCHAGSKIVHKLLVPLEIKCIVHRAAAFLKFQQNWSLSRHINGSMTVFLLPNFKFKSQDRQLM